MKNMMLNKVYEGEEFILYEIKLKRNTIKRKVKIIIPEGIYKIFQIIKIKKK